MIAIREPIWTEDICKEIDRSTADLVRGLREDNDRCVALIRKNMKSGKFEENLFNKLDGLNMNPIIIPIYEYSEPQKHSLARMLDHDAISAFVFTDSANEEWTKSLIPYLMDWKNIDHTFAYGMPAVVEAVKRIFEAKIEHYSSDILVLGRSPNVGIPMASMLAENMDAFVHVVGSHTEYTLHDIVPNYKTIVSCMSPDAKVYTHWLQTGATFIDVGGNLKIGEDEGAEFRFTPASGGVGPLTISILAYRAAAAMYI